VGARVASGPVDSHTVAQGVAGVAGVVGGPKTRAAAAVAAAVTNVYDAGRDSNAHTAAQDAGSEEGELIVFRVLATVPAGSVMPVRSVPLSTLLKLCCRLSWVSQLPVSRSAVGGWVRGGEGRGPYICLHLLTESKGLATSR
jgi:hypothetical protein